MRLLNKSMAGSELMFHPASLPDTFLIKPVLGNTALKVGPGMALSKILSLTSVWVVGSCVGCGLQVREDDQDWVYKVTKARTNNGGSNVETNEK